MTTRAKVDRASGRGQVCYICIIGTALLTWEELGDPGEFEQLDNKLGSAVVSIVYGELGRTIT